MKTEMAQARVTCWSDFLLGPHSGPLRPPRPPLRQPDPSLCLALTLARDGDRSFRFPQNAPDTRPLSRALRGTDGKAALSKSIRAPAPGLCFPGPRVASPPSPPPTPPRPFLVQLLLQNRASPGFLASLLCPALPSPASLEPQVFTPKESSRMFPCRKKPDLCFLAFKMTSSSTALYLLSTDCVSEDLWEGLGPRR